MGNAAAGPPPRLLLCKGGTAKLTVHVFPPSRCSEARSQVHTPGLRLKLQFIEETGKRWRQTWKGGREKSGERMRVREE